jgi:hypothetical protein
MLNRDEDAIRRYMHARGDDQHSDAWRETAFIGGWMVYATREEVEELSEFVVSWLRARRKPEEEREPDTPLVYVPTARCRRRRRGRTRRRSGRPEHLAYRGSR